MPRKFHWELISLVGALFSATCGTSVHRLVAQDDYREASHRCSAEREPGQRQACHRLVVAGLVRALERHIHRTGTYTLARQECAALDDLQQRQTCYRQVADAAFERGERMRTWEAGDSDDGRAYYAHALNAYRDAADKTSPERQKASSYWVAFHDVQTGDEVTAQEDLQAGGHTDAEIHLAFVSLCLRHPTAKCVPLAVKHSEMTGNSPADARHEVGRQCLDRLAQGFHPDASSCAQIAQTLRWLTDATRAVYICVQYLGEVAELRRWQGEILKDAGADLQGYLLSRSEEEQVGDELIGPAKVVFGRARGDRATAARDLEESCRLRGRELAEGELHLLLGAAEFAWADRNGETEHALARAREIAAVSPAALMCQFGPSATDQGSGCESLDHAPAAVETLLKDWRPSDATNEHQL